VGNLASWVALASNGIVLYLTASDEAFFAFLDCFASLATTMPLLEEAGQVNQSADSLSQVQPSRKISSPHVAVVASEAKHIG
jgi:hypothetical protein